MDNQMILETDRLVLRCLLQEDYDDLCLMLKDKEVMYAYEHAFEDREDVYSIIRDTNGPSRAVAERNGMTVRGRIVKQYYGMEMPHLLYGISRSEVG